MSGVRLSKSAVLPEVEVAGIAAGAIISKTKGVFPSTTETVISDVSAGHVGVEAMKVSHWVHSRDQSSPDWLEEHNHWHLLL